RVAESLDRSLSLVVSALVLQDRGDHVVLAAQAASDAELEVWATQRHVGPFERLLHKPVRVESAAERRFQVVGRA
ncbi:MAG: hypothetical protein AB7P99_17745, partial [Vicinamibacterales bacterium]